MLIYHAQVDLDEGYEILERPSRHDRLVRGKRADRPSGWALFHHMKGQPIRCWHCGVEADRWVSEKGRRDKIGNPILNLYAGHVLMTRDHILPKSLGGSDAVGNLRPGCSPCNEARGNEVTPEVIQFALEHPELVDEGRIKLGLERLQASLRPLEEGIRRNQAEIDRLSQPFKLMGYL
jgi:hypothetical protein